ncbi:hypothetical protein JAAARDRAFT_208795 [Jaapia argillacea MUCL 33604]|uniref:CHAT domain-containing protein n=1 Tax=Jaapia argillacea MUCL 33604 TaxID=933084 RepID=A0A067PJE2_9AGAM|nr:hypothetical protein JAAARDRAFT_208795 [Jaapia argillacea MUCL 33604]
MGSGSQAPLSSHGIGVFPLPTIHFKQQILSADGCVVTKIVLPTVHFKQRIEFATGPVHTIHLSFTLNADCPQSQLPDIMSANVPEVYYNSEYLLQASVDVDGCIPFSMAEPVGAEAASWSRGFDFILEDSSVLRLQLHHDRSLYQFHQQLGISLAHLRVVLGSSDGELPVKDSTGTFQLSDGVLVFSVIALSTVKSQSLNDAECLAFLDDEFWLDGDEDVQPKFDELVQRLWSSCETEHHRDLRSGDSWDLHHLLELFEISLKKDRFQQDAENYALKALDLCPSTHPHRFLALAALGKTRMAQFEETGQARELDMAVTLHREALELCPLDYPKREIFLSLFAAASLGYFKQRGGRTNLDQSLKCYGEALGLCPPDHHYRSTALHNLGNASVALFSASGDIADLARGIEQHHEALDLRVPGHPDRPVTLYNIADAYSKRFDRTGELSDLDHAISYCHEALSLRRTRRPEDAPGLTHLAAAYTTRFFHQGDFNDLDRAVQFQQEALELRRNNPSARSVVQGNLGVSLLMRYEHKEDPDDLEQAIKYLARALAMRPRGHPDRQRSFANLGSAYLKRFELKNDLEELQRAVSYHEEAVKLCPSEEHPGNSLFLYNAANTLLSRFAQLHDPSDLDLAAAHLRKAASLLSPDNPTLGLVHLASAREHLMRHALFGKQTDCDQAFQLYEKAAKHSASGTRQQLIAAVRWASLAEEKRHSSSLAAYKRSLHLLDRQVSVGRDVSSRRTLRTGVSMTLASDAAACALDEGQYELAVELLEQGRGLLWAQLFRFRTSLEDLRRLGSTETALADEFDRLSQLLERGAISNDSRREHDGGHEKVNRSYRDITGSWEAVLGRIRQVPGFSYFLEPVPYSSLQKTARYGPIVIINISERRSDAIIMNRTGSPRVVPLPYATPTLTFSLSSNLFSNVRTTRPTEDESHVKNQVEQATRHFRPGNKRKADVDTVLSRILADLWDFVVSPVLDALDLQKDPGNPPPRLFWCPTGPLASLPLHAAGKGTLNAMDFIASSYITTMSSQLRVSKQSVDSPRILLVAQPNTPGEPTLPMVNPELAAVQQAVASYKGVTLRTLSGPDATTKTVKDALGGYHWAHFMCHGSVMNQVVPGAQFAFLSACQTASGDPQTPDEAIHLAAGLLFAGFRSVVATLWSISDDDGPRVAGAFYRILGESGELRGGDAAIALHASVQALRSRGVNPTRWVPFIHLGF